MRFIKADAVTVAGGGFIRLARNQNMCQEKLFSQQMNYTLFSFFLVSKKNHKDTISGNIKLPWKTLLPLMIIYELNGM